MWKNLFEANCHSNVPFEQQTFWINLQSVNTSF